MTWQDFYLLIVDLDALHLDLQQGEMLQRHAADESQGGGMLARTEPKMWGGMNGRARGTSYPPQMVNQTRQIARVLEVCWVVGWRGATRLVMTIQTAAQVHFIFKKKRKEMLRFWKIPLRTPGGHFGQTEARFVLKKPTTAHSKSTKGEQLYTKSLQSIKGPHNMQNSPIIHSVRRFMGSVFHQ